MPEKSQELVSMVLILLYHQQKSQPNKNYHIHSVPALIVIKTGDQIVHQIPDFHRNNLKSFWSWSGNWIGIEDSGRHSWLPPSLEILEEGLLKKINENWNKIAIICMYTWKILCFRKIMDSLHQEVLYKKYKNTSTITQEHTWVRQKAGILLSGW